MSECLHIHDAEGHDVGYVCRPGPLKYHVAVHQVGARKWESVGNPVYTIAQAFRLLGKTLDANRRQAYPRYNRAGIWAMEREPSYYEPHQIYEVSVR